MNSTIVLPSAVMQHQPLRVAHRQRASVAPARPLYVYGDSTPFSAAVDFIATIRALVACGVSLMNSQHAIDCARSRVREAQEHLFSTTNDLNAVAQAVEAALIARGPHRAYVREVSQRLATMTRGAVSVEVRRAQAALDASVVRADKTIVEARTAAAAAFGEMLSRHDLPGASGGFRIFASEERYRGEVVVSLTCGLRATFDATMPVGHAWGTLRRVRDAREGVSITLPCEVGWLKKRVEPLALNLDGLTVLGASVEGARGALLLGKSERAGVTHAFDIDLSSATPRATWRGSDDGAEVPLDIQDAATMTQLLRAIELATRELVPARRTMTEATLDKRPLGQCDPGEACTRLIALVAAHVHEIARRSGAAGELVLRRNVDSGHRHEVFVTTAELLEQVETLPPSLRRAFDPLELNGKPRSPRAPARSLATYEEISACEVLPAE